MQHNRKIEAGNCEGSKDKSMTVAIIGTGLIGGSLAFALREHNLSNRIIGVDASQEHIKKSCCAGYNR